MAALSNFYLSLHPSDPQALTTFGFQVSAITSSWVAFMSTASLPGYFHSPRSVTSEVADDMYDTDIGTTSDRKATQHTRHSQYYMEDEMSIFLVQYLPNYKLGSTSKWSETFFQVENTLFKVHRYFLARESDIFGVMFQLPAGQGAAEDGRNDEQPITLPGVTVEEFKCLLDFFYHG